MTEKSAKLSLIIPVYNCEESLRKALNSVVNQTLNDIEIICVDDGSTDMSAEIIAGFAAEDSRIRYIRHDENKGCGMARKTGIMASTGEYIMFLDGDDFLSLNACDELYYMARRAQTDIFQFGTTIIPCGVRNQTALENMEKLLTPYDMELRECRKGELVSQCFVERHFDFMPWNKIYFGDVVRHAAQYYVEDNYGVADDIYLFFLIAFFSKSYTSVEKKYYYYHYTPGITEDGFGADKKFDSLSGVEKMLEKLQEFLKQSDPFGYCLDAVDAVKKSHLSSVVYGWLYDKNEDRAAAMKHIFAEYKKEDILVELLHWYHKADSDRKEKILAEYKSLPVFQSKKKEIKTIGTYYVRMRNGGIERVLSILMEIWCKQGYQVVLFTDEIPSADDYPYPEGIKRVILPTIQTQDISQYKKRITYWHEMLEKYNVDCLVNHAWVSTEIELDLLAVKSAGIPVVMHTHGLFAYAVSNPSSWWAYHTIFISKLYSMADAVITLTKTDYNWWSMFHRRVYQTINPVSFDVNHIPLAPTGKRRLVYAGRISPEKQIEDMLYILRRVIDAGYPTQLHLVGTCEQKYYRNQLKTKAEELEIEEYVIMHGFHDDVSPFYRDGGISLLTSKSEGYCLSLIESMVFGLPVVLYDLPNLDIVQKRKGLVAVPQRDVNAAANAIISMFADEQKYQTMAREAQESVREMYSLDLGVFWTKVFSDLEKCDQYAELETDYNQVKNAVHIMVDAYLEGVLCREEEKQKIAQRGAEVTGDPVLEVVKRSYEGELGFRFIFKFIWGWLKYKLFRSRKRRF